MSVSFDDLYDGRERMELFFGDMKIVPSEERDLSSWLTIVTFFDEEEEHARIQADVVYLTCPQTRVMVRIKAMVTSVEVGLTR